jgi:hypothetical protein
LQSKPAQIRLYLYKLSPARLPYLILNLGVSNLNFLTKDQVNVLRLVR